MLHLYFLVHEPQQRFYYYRKHLLMCAIYSILLLLQLPMFIIAPVIGGIAAGLQFKSGLLDAPEAIEEAPASDDTEAEV